MAVWANAALKNESILVFSSMSCILYWAAGDPQVHKAFPSLPCWSKWQNCVALLPTHRLCLMISFVVFSHNSCKVLNGLWRDWAVSFRCFTSGRSLSLILFFGGRCSHRDQFVVILVVMLLFNVVLNNSTIYGQTNELECVIVLAVALEAGGHFVTGFLNISHSPSTAGGISLVLRLLSDTGPTSFGSLGYHLSPRWGLHDLTVDTPLFPSSLWFF